MSKGNGWVETSNGLAVLSAGMMALGILTFDSPQLWLFFSVVTIVSLALSYFCAKKIPDCEVPAYRVIFVWSYFVALCVGLVIPLSVLISHGYSHVLLIFVALGVVFGLFARFVFLKVKAGELK